MAAQDRTLFEQAKQFVAVTQISSLAITKLDGTAKGGVVIGISDQLKRSGEVYRPWRGYGGFAAL